MRGVGGADKRGDPAVEEPRVGIGGEAGLERFEVEDGGGGGGVGTEEGGSEARGDEGLADAGVGAEDGKGRRREGQGGGE